MDDPHPGDPPGANPPAADGLPDDFGTPGDSDRLSSADTTPDEDTRKGDISLKKIGLELIVGVDGQRRTIILPSAMAAFQPTSATFEEGTLAVTFQGASDG